MPHTLKVTGQTSLQIPGLGRIDGLIYENGVRQFYGIPYARLSKRWTRALLATSWENNYHDGTEYGPSPVNPPEFDFDQNPSVLLPFAHFPHLKHPVTDELNCLVMNITLPPASVIEQHNGPLPIFTFIHGGSFIYGCSNRSVFDLAHLVTQSVSIQQPIIGINFNYRIGFCGFAASRQIHADLEADGLPGNGNFGLTDQRTALEWIHRYILHFGGNSDEITIAGESAGGTSVSILAASSPDPAPFARVAAMSGHSTLIPIWTPEQHQKIYDTLARAFKIDPDAADSLEQLRAIPEKELQAKMSFVHGVAAPVCLPCDDGCLLDDVPGLFDQTRKTERLPTNLKGYMIGDCGDEGMIFGYDIEVSGDDYAYLRNTLCQYMSSDKADTILQLYNATPDKSLSEVQQIMLDMTGDAAFCLPAWLSAHQAVNNEPKIPVYPYHFDQRSTFPGESAGFAHHAHDLMYLFANWPMDTYPPTPGQQNLITALQNAYIRFTYGKDEPWESFHVAQKWKVWGPDDRDRMLSEEEDESARHYARFKGIMDAGVLREFYDAMDEVGMKRSRIGTGHVVTYVPPEARDEND